MRQNDPALDSGMKLPQGIKNWRHHWWPEALIKGWCDHNKVATIRLDVPFKPLVKMRRVPKSSGFIAHAHNLIRGFPWNSSFETDFEDADRDIPRLISWIMGEAGQLHTAQRIRAITLGDEERGVMTRLVASLIARSPCTRDRAKSTAEYYRSRFGFSDPSADRNLVSANIRPLYADYTERVMRYGKFALIKSRSKKLCFGDGFLHNFPLLRTPALEARCLVPVSPYFAILWTRPQELYRIQPECVLIESSDEEVDFINRTIQIYSGNWLFHHPNEDPIIYEDFLQGRHEIWSNSAGNHHHPILDGMISEILSFRV